MRLIVEKQLIEREEKKRCNTEELGINFDNRCRILGKAKGLNPVDKTNPSFLTKLGHCIREFKQNISVYSSPKVRVPASKVVLRYRIREVALSSDVRRCMN